MIQINPRPIPLERVVWALGSVLDHARRLRNPWLRWAGLINVVNVPLRAGHRLLAARVVSNLERLLMPE